MARVPRATLAALLVTGLGACAPARPAPDGRESLAGRGQAGLRAIRAEALSAHVRFLSDDLLEGRFTGTRGHAIAERYVASQLAALGVEPGAPGGGWLQDVPLRAARVDLARSSLVISGAGRPDETFLAAADFVPFSDFRSPSVDVTAPLAFGGYGVVAPEYAYDDLAGVDWKGKVALLLAGAPLSDRPDFFPPAPSATYNKWLAKMRRLEARGAVGVLLAWTPAQEERYGWSLLARDAEDEEMAWTTEGGEAARQPARLPARGAVSAGAAARILERAGVPGGFDGIWAAAGQNALRARDLGLTVRVRTRSSFRELQGHNVLGLWRGSDPVLSREVVVYSAHLDHLGVGVPVKGDAIYNGAIDNASGVAGVLEVARAFRALPARPARSILFALVTGEEVGYVGSDYLARHPPVPREALVANLNIDMILALHPIHEVVALGDGHSSLALPAGEAAAALGLVLGPDPAPARAIFVRSDQFSFVEQGVPALFPLVGGRGRDGPSQENQARIRAWFARYHQPDDEWSEDYDYEAMAQLVRFDFLVGLSVASRPERPRWNRGDFFERYPRAD